MAPDDTEDDDMEMVEIRCGRHGNRQREEVMQEVAPVGSVASSSRQRFLVEVLPAIMRRLYLLSQCQQYVVATCALEASGSRSRRGVVDGGNNDDDDDCSEYHETEIVRIQVQTASMMRTSSFRRDEKLAQFMDNGSLIQLAVDMLLRGQRLAPFPCAVDNDRERMWRQDEGQFASEKGGQDDGVREKVGVANESDVLFTAIWLVLMLALIRVKYKMF